MADIPRISPPPSPMIQRHLQLIATSLTIISVFFTISNSLNLHIPLLYNTISQKTVGLIAASVQIVALICFSCAAPPLPRMSSKKYYEIAIVASNRFLPYWRAVWISWAILYISWFCFSVFHPLGINDTLPHITSDFLNLLSGAMLVLCYLLMVVKSEPPHKVGWYNIVSIVICVCIRLVFIEAITTSGAHGQFTRLDGARVYFDSVDGLLVGMGTALFVGRLGSEFFDSSKWAIALLYGYAVIQLAYPFLEDETSILGPIFTIVTCIALLSKIILFSTVAKLISSGKLTYYMLEYRLSLSVKSSERDEIIADILTADGER